MTGHLNQADGPFHASLHPNVAGREVELRSMADAVRRLVEIVVTNTADAPATAEAAQRLHALADDLEVTVPAEPPSRYGGGGAHPHDHFQFDSVLGLYNPLALPVEVSWEPPLALGRACFPTAYEGPPGLVHGAVIAGVFDQVCNVANVENSVAGPTATLSITYRRPTFIDVPLVVEAWVDAIDGRKITTKGRLIQDGELTCEAEGLFIKMDMSPTG